VRRQIAGRASGVSSSHVSALFVLGGDVWDKVRALFVYQARAVFPTSAST